MPGKVIQGPWESSLKRSDDIPFPNDIDELLIVLDSPIEYMSILRNSFVMLRRERKSQIEATFFLTEKIINVFLLKLTQGVVFDFLVDIPNEIIEMYKEMHVEDGNGSIRINTIEKIYDEVQRIPLIVYLRVICRYLVSDLDRPELRSEPYLVNISYVLQEVLIDLNSIISNYSI